MSKLYRGIKEKDAPVTGDVFYFSDSTNSEQMVYIEWSDLVALINPQPRLIEEISANQDVALTTWGYWCDTSGGDVTVTFNIPATTFTDGQQWEFKKIDAANNMIVAVSGGLIDGYDSVSIPSLNDAVTVTYFNGNFYII
jgi:hypothetical protein